MYNGNEEEWVNTWGDVNRISRWVNEEMAKKMAEVMPAYIYNGFDPLKAQFRRAEIYKRALKRAVDWHNYEGHVNHALKNVTYHELDINELIDIAKAEVDNGK